MGVQSLTNGDHCCGGQCPTFQCKSVEHRSNAQSNFLRRGGERNWRAKSGPRTTTRMISRSGREGRGEGEDSLAYHLSNETEDVSRA